MPESTDFLARKPRAPSSDAKGVKKFFSFAVMNFALLLGAVILASSAQAQSAYVTIQCNDTNNPQINSQSTNSLSLQSGNATCAAIAYSGIASGYWQYSYNGGPFQYLTGAQVSVSRSGIPYGIYQVQAIGTDANGNPITSSNVVTINYSAAGGGGGGSGGDSGGGSGGGSAAGQDPGPSAALFNSPYYQCTKNVYVSTTGNDTTGNGTQSAPWLTLRHADSMNLGAGACINVAPGTYDGLVVHNGGNAATSTGYVVYRCQQLDACIVTGNGGVNNSSSFDTVRTTNGVPPNFVQIDGFEMVGSGTFYATAVGVFNGDNSSKVAGHHIWVLNSIVHGFGEAGISFGNADYHYAIHNIAYDNALLTCDAQGSGIAAVAEHDVPSYTPTADDQVPYSGFGFPTWELGDGTFFHVVIAYNVTHNNYLSGCGAGTVTDSNGIIFDTNSLPGGNSTDYHNPMLAYGNVSYNNGGGGVHVFASYNVTVANNTAFNNYLDPEERAGFGAIDDNEGGNTDSNGTTYVNYFYNNIGVSCTSAFPPAPGIVQDAAILLGPKAGTTADDPAQGNVTFMVTNNNACGPEVHIFNNQTYNTTQNRMTANPLWVNVPFDSPGSDSTPPGGTNFALSPGSPAIGYGITKPYLPSSSVDAGACPSTLTTCP
jgi:parallel beta-helix repeat protein